MLDESAFHRLADHTLDLLAETLEESDEKAALDIDLHGGVLTIGLPSGKQCLVNKHGPSRQLWLASSRHGGLHFDYDEAAQRWRLTDGRDLVTLLAEEVREAAGVVWNTAL